VDNTLKLQTAEQKMGELTSAMAVLGKEAAAAMTAVEAQQQRLTLQRLIAMVEAERSYHQRIAEILDQLQAQVFAVLYLHFGRGGLLMLAFLSSLEKAIYMDK
jgi:hypothetical protein